MGGVAVRGTILTSCVVALALIGATLGAARAQGHPTPPPITSVPADTVLASSYAVFDLGTNYLYNSSGQGGLAGLAHMFGATNPNGGGAPDATHDPRYRAWTAPSSEALSRDPRHAQATAHILLLVLGRETCPSDRFPLTSPAQRWAFLSDQTLARWARAVR